MVMMAALKPKANWRRPDSSAPRPMKSVVAEKTEAEEVVVAAEELFEEGAAPKEVVEGEEPAEEEKPEN